MATRNNPDTSKWENQSVQSYLLRLWQEEPGGAWRILLLETASSERHGFADLDHLFEYLGTQLENK